MVAGRVGLCVSCMSYYETFKICITADEEVCKDTAYLTDLIYKNIMDEIERVEKKN
jgi:hypothetical protein